MDAGLIGLGSDAEVVSAEAIGVLLPALGSVFGVGMAEPGAALGLQAGDGLGDDRGDLGGFGGVWAGEFAPGRARQIQETGGVGAFVKEGEPVLQEGEVELVVFGDLFQALDASEVSVFPLPGGEHVVGFPLVVLIGGDEGGGSFLIPDVEALLDLLFDLLKAAESDFLSVKLDAGAWEDGGVFGEVAGGAEVLVQLLRIQEKGVADIGEAFATAAVRGELVGPRLVDASELLEGVLVFDVGEAAEGDGAGIAGIAGSDGVKAAFDPTDDGFFFSRQQRVGVLGRHLPGFNDLDDFFPDIELAFDVGLAELVFQADAAFGFLVIVTVDASGLQSLTDGGPLACGGGRGEGEKESGKGAKAKSVGHEKNGPLAFPTTGNGGKTGFGSCSQRYVAKQSNPAGNTCKFRLGSVEATSVSLPPGGYFDCKLHFISWNE